jgi:hypothetical protein
VHDNAVSALELLEKSLVQHAIRAGPIELKVPPTHICGWNYDRSVLG